MPGDRPIWAENPERNELSRMLNELVFWLTNDGQEQVDDDDSDVEPGQKKRGRKPADSQVEDAINELDTNQLHELLRLFVLHH